MNETEDYLNILKVLHYAKNKKYDDMHIDLLKRLLRNEFKSILEKRIK